MLRGFDASFCQGKLPWSLIKDEYAFCILKGQSGNDGFDPSFEQGMKAAFANGLEAFAYCFAYPLPHIDPKAEAQQFVNAVYKFPEMKGRPIFVDLEWPAPILWTAKKCTAQQISDWCKALCEEITRLTGIKPVIYTYPDWWNHVAAGADVSWAAEYSLWLAEYIHDWPKDGENPKYLLKPWTSWLFWQFDGNGGLKLPNGVDADFCVFNGDLAALKAFAQPVVTESENMPVVHPDVPL